ncbi:MAG: hypothetical protein ABSF80_10930, partial [Chitinispirillaceae bacterium]
MKTMAFALLCSTLVLSSASAKDAAGTAAKNVISVKDSAVKNILPVKDTAAIKAPSKKDSASGSALPVTDTSAVAVPHYNDTSTVRHILDECGLITVKIEQVTVWDSGRVVSLDLSNNDLTQDGFKALPVAVCSLTQLRTLMAKNN